MQLNPIKIGERIKEKQLEHGYKQKEIIEKTGISKAAISNYVNGNRIPDTEAALKLSIALDISIEWLLTGKNSLEKLTNEEEKIIQAYRSASPGIQEATRKILDIKELEEKLYDWKNGKEA